MKPSIKRPASLPAPRLERRHASPIAQENGTGSAATALDARHGTARNTPHTPIPTAGTPDTNRKTSRRREGSPQERHRKRPKCNDGTPTEGENGNETARLAARRTGRGTRRGMECLRNRWEQEEIGEPAGRGTGWDAAIIEEKQVSIETAGSADVVLSDKDPTLRGNYPHFYEDKNGELKYLYH